MSPARRGAKKGSTGKSDLVDLPLAPPQAEEGGPPAPPTATEDGPARTEKPDTLPLFPEDEMEDMAEGLLGETGEGVEEGVGGQDDEPPFPALEESEAPDVGVPSKARFLHRLSAAGADFIVHGAVLSAGVTSMALLGLEPRLEDWPGLLCFVVAFSFLYNVVPLAFWGQTPGMAWSGVKAMDRGRRPLTFGQTFLRWIASLATVLLAGLPLLLLFFRTSLADLVSRSETWQEGPNDPV